MSNATHPNQPPAASPADLIAQQMGRLQAQAAASLGQAQELVLREQQRLAALLEQKPEQPNPRRFDLAGGLDAIRRTMEATSDYLAKHLAANPPATVPLPSPTFPAATPPTVSSAPLPEMPTP